ncbi:MAG: type I-U CRISPR-associated RAMP protein Csb1/Cas7u [Bryobacteraceae bacterium]
MPASLNLNELMMAVAGSAAAFRSVTKLQPVGGEGDKVFPATYSEGKYATERRALGESMADCVLLDSVQSQANRAEEALKLAVERGRTKLPLIEVDFQEANSDFRNPLPNLTSLDVPHRLADAILRDSLLADGTRFSKSQYAQRWGRSNLWNATAVYELCPTALVFGMWGSPDKPGGLGAKFERAFVSEIVAVDVTEIEKRSGFRIDPLSIQNDIYSVPNEDGGFKVVENEKVKGAKKPSELNHGNIIYPKSGSVLRGGIRFRYAEQTTVVSLGALRKLRFPIDGKDDSQVNNAGRAVLAVLGLCAGVLASEANTSLRSRCHLWPVQEREWELLEKPGQPPRKFRVSGDGAIALLNEAIAAAKQMKLPWMEEKLILKPSKELIDLITQSQEAAAKEKGEGEAK